MSLPKLPYQAEWERLCKVVAQQDDRVRAMRQLFGHDAEWHPAEWFVSEIDTAEARRILDEIDALRPKIAVALEALNSALARLDRPPIEVVRAQGKK